MMPIRSLTSVCADSRAEMWGGLSAGRRPLGGFCFRRRQACWEAGCRLNSPPHPAVFTHRCNQEIS